MESYIEIIVVAAIITLWVSLIKKRSLIGLMPSAFCGLFGLFALSLITIEGVKIITANIFTGIVAAFLGAPGVFCMVVMRFFAMQ